jgi:hypothetical protein
MAAKKSELKRSEKRKLSVAAVFVLSALVVFLMAVLATCDINSQFTEAIQEKVNEDLGNEDAVVTIAAVPGVTPPASGETPVTEISETDQYTGTVSWDPADDYFAAETIYTATITLTAKSGYTFTGVAADFFTVAGADSVSNNADSGVVTAVFPATGYSVNYHANEGTAGTVPTDATEYNSGDEVTVLGNTGNLVGAPVGGEHTGSGIKQRFIGWNTNSGATTAEYVAGDTFTITENTTLYAIYTTGTDVLRKVGPAGGWVFYDAENTQSWGRYLEAAPASTEWSGKEWGDRGTKIDITELTGIGDGRAATDAIVAHMEDNSITGTAAQLCDGPEMEYGGYSDWFLPSIDELNKMYENLQSGTDENFVTYTPIGGFASGVYWSSSEDSRDDAWLQYFSDGSQHDDLKDNSRRVRASRAF